MIKMMDAVSPAPWTSTLTQPEYMITSYFIVIAGLAMFAGFLRSWMTGREVGSRYRGAVIARLAITGVAFLSYIGILAEFLTAYSRVGDVWVPSDRAINMFALRYADWSVTVPLLCFELLAVCMVAGAAARRTQIVTLSASFMMIFTGYLGAVVFDDGESTSTLITWGLVSSVFWIFTTVVLIRAVRKSAETLTPEAYKLLKHAAILLLCGWAVYPVIYSLQIYTSGGFWVTIMVVGLCIIDIIVKIGFGTLIHSVAKLRTAEDVRAGDDVHSESIWISSVKQSDAGRAREVFIAHDKRIHPERARPPLAQAVPGYDEDDDPDVYSTDDRGH